MQVNVGGGDAGKYGALQEPEHGRRPERQYAMVGDAGNNLGKCQANGQRGQQKNETGNGPGDAHVEQCPFGVNRRADADEGPQRSGKGRRGQKKGQAGIEAVINARQIMPEFVRRKDR